MYCHVNVLVRRLITLHIPIFIIYKAVLSYLILSYLILSYLILSYLILSYLILSYLILSYLILSYLILSYLILSYLILSYLILSYVFLSLPQGHLAPRPAASTKLGLAFTRRRRATRSTCTESASTETA